MPFTENKKRQLSIISIAMGLHLLMLYHFVMVWFDEPDGVSFEKIVAGSFLFAAGILFSIGGLIEIQKGTLSSFSPAIRLLFFLLMSWGLITIIKSFNLDFRNLRTLFGNRHAAWTWSVPIVMVVGAKTSSWRLLNDIFIRHARAGVVLTVVLLLLDPITGIDFAGSTFGMFYASGFLLLTWVDQTNNAKTCGTLGMLMFFLACLLKTGRVNLALSACYVGCAFCLYLTYVKWHLRKVRNICVVITVVIVVGALVWPLVSSSLLIGDSMDQFRDKIFRDTRSVVVGDFLGSVTGWDRIVGRGAMGKFWSPYFMGRWMFEDIADSPERSTIELGYLYIILKGGYVMLVLFLTITIPAAILGICNSNNRLVKACSLVIIITLLGMIPSFHPCLQAPYILFWLSVGACLNRKIRLATNQELFPAINKDRYNQIES